MSRLNFYKDRICLNVLGGSLENAKNIVEAAEGFVVVGVLSANYPNVESALASMTEYQKVTNDRLSVGLGAGNPNYCYAVKEISSVLHPAHINQVINLVGSTREALKENEGWINALVSPSGRVGYVSISTGPRSSNEEKAIVPIKAAIAMIQEVGGNAIKFFPMDGLKSIEEYRCVAKECALANLGLEPTGGIDLGNFKEVLQIAIQEGVQKIVPHVYSAIIDKSTGETRVADVKKLLIIIKEVLK